jgi:FkbM family methyltransferase
MRDHAGQRFDLVEVLLISVTVALVSLAGARAYTLNSVRESLQLDYNFRRAEVAPLEHAFGPGHSSQFAEEWIIRDFFHDKRDGVFVDVGANQYQQDSTTYYLETGLGWHGLAIDAQREFADGYRANRPRTQFFTFFVSDRTDATAQVFIPAGRTMNATGIPEGVNRGAQNEVREVPTIRLDDLLTRTGIDRLDFLSIDIELAEPKALAGFDVDRFKPTFVCIEGHWRVRQQILDYFHRHNYVLIGKYLRADVVNLYFMPASEVRSGGNTSAGITPRVTH